MKVNELSSSSFEVNGDQEQQSGFAPVFHPSSLSEKRWLPKVFMWLIIIGTFIAGVSCGIWGLTKASMINKVGSGCTVDVFSVESELADGLDTMLKWFPVQAARIRENKDDIIKHMVSFEDPPADSKLWKLKLIVGGSSTGMPDSMQARRLNKNGVNDGAKQDPCRAEVKNFLYEAIRFIRSSVTFVDWDESKFSKAFGDYVEAEQRHTIQKWGENAVGLASGDDVMARGKKIHRFLWDSWKTEAEWLKFLVTWLSEQTGNVWETTKETVNFAAQMENWLGRGYANFASASSLHLLGAPRLFKSTENLREACSSESTPSAASTSDMGALCGSMGNTSNFALDSASSQVQVPDLAPTVCGWLAENQLTAFMNPLILKPQRGSRFLPQRASGPVMSQVAEFERPVSAPLTECNREGMMSNGEAMPPKQCICLDTNLGDDLTAYRFDRPTFTLPVGAPALNIMVQPKDNEPGSQAKYTELNVFKCEDFMFEKGEWKKMMLANGLLKDNQLERLVDAMKKEFPGIKTINTFDADPLPDRKTRTGKYVSQVIETLKVDTKNIFRKQPHWDLFTPDVKLIDQTGNTLEGLDASKLLLEVLRAARSKLSMKEAFWARPVRSKLSKMQDAASLFDTDAQIAGIDGAPFEKFEFATNQMPNLVANFDFQVGREKKPWKLFSRFKDSINVQAVAVLHLNENGQVDCVRMVRFVVDGHEVPSWPKFTLGDDVDTNSRMLLDWLENIRKERLSDPVRNGVVLHQAGAIDTDESPSINSIFVPSRHDLKDKQAAEYWDQALDRASHATGKMPAWLASQRERTGQVCNAFAKALVSCKKACTSHEALQACTITCAADVVVQVVSGARLPSNYNFLRTFSYGVYGMCYQGGFQPNVYSLFDRWFGNGKSMRVVMPKLLVDMLAYVPLMYLPSFFMITGLVQGLGLSGSWLKMASKYRELLKSYFAIWTVPTFVIFRSVPEKYRTVAFALFGFVEKCVFSYLAAQSSLPAAVGKLARGKR